MCIWYIRPEGENTLVVDILLCGSATEIWRMCSFILFSPSFEASLVNTTTGISSVLLKSSNIFCNFCPQNPVLQPANQRSKRSGRWSPRCTAPPPTTRWWCRPTCFSIPTKKIFTSGKSFFPWYKLKHFQRNVVEKSTKYLWDAFLSAQHRGSPTRVGSNSVAGFFSLLMWLWVYIKIFDLFFFVAITFCCLWL